MNCNQVHAVIRVQLPKSITLISTCQLRPGVLVMRNLKQYVREESKTITV